MISLSRSFTAAATDAKQRPGFKSHITKRRSKIGCNVVASVFSVVRISEMLNGANGMSDIEHAVIEEMELLGKAT